MSVRDSNDKNDVSWINIYKLIFILMNNGINFNSCILITNIVYEKRLNECKQTNLYSN